MPLSRPGYEFQNFQRDRSCLGKRLARDEYVPRISKRARSFVIPRRRPVLEGVACAHIVRVHSLYEESGSRGNSSQPGGGHVAVLDGVSIQPLVSFGVTVRKAERPLVVVKNGDVIYGGRRQGIKAPRSLVVAARVGVFDEHVHFTQLLDFGQLRYRRNAAERFAIQSVGLGIAIPSPGTGA